MKIEMSKAITGKKLKEIAKKNTGLSLVQFKKDWIGACQIIEPVFNELSHSYTGIAKFFTVDVEHEKDVEKEYGVAEFPTILFFKNGKMIDHIAGLMPKNLIVTKIENALTV